MDLSAHTFTLDYPGGTPDSIQEQPSTSSLRTWSDLATGRLSFAAYFERLANVDDLTCLTIDTTGACDLTCKGMCYYHPSIRITDREVPLHSATRAIEDAWKTLGMKTLVIAGKEPFLNPRRLFDLLEFAGRLPGRDFATDIITNGRHIERNWDRLARVAEQGWLDSLDISIDSGIPEQHDAIRGLAGTHALAVSALRKVILELPMVRASACSVLRTDNPAGILDLIRSQSDLVRRFWVFPLQPPPFSQIAPLTPSFVVSFLRDLANLLAGELRDREIIVTVPIQGLYLSEVADAGLIYWHALREDALGNCVSSLGVGKSLLNLQCCVLPEQATKLARITYTGDYLAQAHFLQTPDPRTMAIGNIDREPIRELYRRSKLPGSIFHQLVLARQSHDCIRQNCWQTCFGGWSVAEQSLLDGTPLDRRSRLCRKAQSDLISIAGVTIS